MRINDTSHSILWSLLDFIDSPWFHDLTTHFFFNGADSKTICRQNAQSVHSLNRKHSICSPFVAVVLYQKSTPSKVKNPLNYWQDAQLYDSLPPISLTKHKEFFRAESLWINCVNKHLVKSWPASRIQIMFFLPTQWAYYEAAQSNWGRLQGIPLAYDFSSLGWLQYSDYTRHTSLTECVLSSEGDFRLCRG